jgi:hypothetical protein
VYVSLVKQGACLHFLVCFVWSSSKGGEINLYVFVTKLECKLPCARCCYKQLGDSVRASLEGGQSGRFWLEQ